MTREDPIGCISLADNGEQLLRDLMSNSPTPLALLEFPDERFRFVNPAFTDYTGYSEAEAVGRTALEMHLWTDSNVRESFRGSLQRSGTVRNTLVQVRRKDGEIRDFVVNGNLITVEHQRCLLAQAMDVTEQRQAEDLLSQSEQYYRRFVEFFPGIAYLTDLTFRPRFFHGAVAALTGYPEKAFVQGDVAWPELVHRDDRETFETIRRDGDKGKGPLVLRYRLNHAQGKVVWLEDTRQGICNQKGVLRYLQGTIRDITAQKQAESRSASYRDQLAHAGRLSNLGEMAAGIAHEVNQPLCAISSSLAAGLRLLRSGAGSREDILEALEHAAAETERASEILQHVRAFAKKTPLKRQWADPARLITEAIGFVRPDAALHGVRIDTDLPQDCPRIRCDGVQIEQVLLNIFRNALDAMAESSVQRPFLMVRLAELTDGQMEFSVADSGPGIAPELLEKVFEAFFSTKASGVGIGLSISRAIIEAHGGRLWATANRDRGTMFTFTLPSNRED